MPRRDADPRGDARSPVQPPLARRTHDGGSRREARGAVRRPRAGVRGARPATARAVQRAAALGISGSIVARALASASPALARPAGPTKGGVLREGYDRDVSKIDPVATSWWDATLFPVTHETLLTADPSGKFTPMIARSWSVSKDGKTWTFKLRSGLKFQSGAPLDAKAIKAAFNEIRTKGVNAGFWGPVASVIARNSTTLVIKLKHPYADLPYVLNSGYSAIYNKKTRDKLKAGYGSKGVDGSGPVHAQGVRAR